MQSRVDTKDTILEKSGKCLQTRGWGDRDGAFLWLGSWSTNVFAKWLPSHAWMVRSSLLEVEYSCAACLSEIVNLVSWIEDWNVGLRMVGLLGMAGCHVRTHPVLSVSPVTHTDISHSGLRITSSSHKHQLNVHQFPDLQRRRRISSHREQISTEETRLRFYLYRTHTRSGEEWAKDALAQLARVGGGSDGHVGKYWRAERALRRVKDTGSSVPSSEPWMSLRSPPCRRRGRLSSMWGWWRRYQPDEVR